MNYISYIVSTTIGTKGLFICAPKYHFVPKVLARCKNPLPKVSAGNAISARRCTLQTLFVENSFPKPFLQTQNLLEAATKGKQVDIYLGQRRNSTILGEPTPPRGKHQLASTSLRKQPQKIISIRPTGKVGGQKAKSLPFWDQRSIGRKPAGEAYKVRSTPYSKNTI